MATPSECIVPDLHFDNTLGAAFIGTILAAVLYGITSLQTYIYFDRCRDASWLKFLVFFLWTVDTVHLALMTRTVYFYAVSNFMNPFALMNVTWSIMVSPNVKPELCRYKLNVTSGGCDYNRLQRRDGPRVFTILASSQERAKADIFKASFHTDCGNVGERTEGLVNASNSDTILACLRIAFTVRGAVLGMFAAFPEISWILYTAFGAGALVDVTIAVSLCSFLWQRRTGFRRTDSLVRVLMMYSINTGALTSICALIVLVAYATMPNNFIFICFYFMLPKLFLNSLLATLNAREKLRDNSSGPGGMVSIPLSTNLSSPIRTTMKTDLSRRTSDQAVEIQVETTTDRKTDSMSHLPPQASTEWACCGADSSDHSCSTGLVLRHVWKPLVAGTFTPRLVR
ncbi:hypothetical protein NM688_g2216 [Phlebia brevispora]|uniref:Uncharacterized protein n=1 Tax=Phlebia brevispora TaxID=194682 RepID=A0ACC1T9B3_9APHY|nr:hypothetical protein NM688_g2216 [Phlebia brevispora]